MNWYSAQPLSIRNSNSVVCGDSIFTGQYWDEFALTGSFVKPDAKVLILGFAMGGGVRSLLSSVEKAAITGVDADGKILDDASALYRTHFPQIQIEFVQAFAQAFLQTGEE